MTLQSFAVAKRAIERFEPKYCPEALTGCWIWWASVTVHGYGAFYLPKGNGKYRRIHAHRWAYEYFRGPVPDGLCLDHLCRNRACVNPDHLEPVTLGENVLRGVGITAQNAKKTTCPRGHRFDREWNGDRYCRACKNWLQRERRRAEAAKRAA